jgi:hypothetical protein
MNLVSGDDPVGVSAQLCDDHLRLGIAWGDPRPTGDYEPAEATALRNKAKKVLVDEKKPNSWWLASTASPMTIEEACRGIAASDMIANQAGRNLGKLMKEIEPELRKAILALASS